MQYQSRNPATGTLIETHDMESPAGIQSILVDACKGYGEWKNQSLDQREAIVREIASVLERQQEHLARTMTLEMGKPLEQSRSEIAKAQRSTLWYAENFRKLSSPDVSQADAGITVQVEASGISFAIMPWNYPVWQVLRCALPALLLGNAFLLKPAENVVKTTLLLREAVIEAGVPSNVFQVVLAGRDQTETIIAHDCVTSVTFTGSAKSGAVIGQLAGKHLKKPILELGGSDPFIVLDDANLDTVVPTAVKARFGNSGQACTAAKRILVSEKIVDEFVDRFISQVDDLIVGDPLEGDTDVGPVARSDLRDKLHSQVQSSVEKGAAVARGGHPIEGDGYFFDPTVVLSPPEDSPVWREETFGPVAVIADFATDDEAIRMANATQYGLGASVWSPDLERAYELGRHVESGILHINSVVTSNVRAPFGGTKQSGFGRELGKQGILELANLRAVHGL